MLTRKSNHPQLLRAVVELIHLHFHTARNNTNTRLYEREKKLHNLCYVVVQHKVSAHHGATGEYGVEMNRYLRLCLESEGRGDG